MKRSVRVAMLICCFLFCFSTGCSKTGNVQNDYSQQNNELAKLLPPKTGFIWVYSGFAEYGHQLELVSLEKEEREIKYHLTGRVDDPSGGEAAGDFSLELDYLIKNGVLIQRKNGEKMMDSFVETQLIRYPLEKGTHWEQEVKDYTGKEYLLSCEIEEVKEEEGRIYTVVYRDKSSDFYERRWIKEDSGVVSFEKLWIHKEGADSIGYMIYPEASGYTQAISRT